MNKSMSDRAFSQLISEKMKKFGIPYQSTREIIEKGLIRKFDFDLSPEQPNIDDLIERINEGEMI